MGQPLRVLLIEDSEDDALLLVDALTQGGYEPFVKRVDTQEAMSMALTEQPWDLVISDFVIPNFGGLAALELLQKSGLDLPIIIVSGKIGENVAVDIMKAGAADCVMKGNLARLCPAIDKILQGVEDRRQKRLADEALRQSEVRYRNLYDSAPVAYFSVDATNGRITGANQAATELTGYTQETLLGMHTLDLYADTPDRNPLAIRVVEQAMAGESCRDTEFQIRHKNGQLVWISLYVDPVVDGDGNVCEARAIAMDISPRKQAEDALLQSEGRYRAIVDSITDYIYSVFIEEGQVTKTVHGPGCVAVTGYLPEEYETDPELWLRMIPEEDRELVVGYADQVLTGTEPAPLRHRIIHKNGETRWVKNTVVPRYNPKGALIAYDALVSDVTTQKELEEQLRQAQKMEAIGTLAGGIAHDFNNILTAILGFSEILLLDLPKGDPRLPLVEPIHEAGKRAKDLVKQILAFSRQTEYNRSPLRLSLIVKEALKLLRASIPQTIEIRVNVSPEPGTVMAAPTEIHQVIMNLCTNAYHAMREHGGKMEVVLEPVTIAQENAAAQPQLTKGNYMRLLVRDTGCGMDAATINRIFEPYYTTKPAGEGTGLGLSVVYGIVESLGGLISVDSTPGKGSTFQVYLPRLDVEAADQASNGTRPCKGSGRILFVDDEPPVAMLGKELLKRLGYEVVAMTDGHEALEAFRSQPEAFDLVITDQMMPKMTGLELSKQLLAIRPKLPVIFITGFKGNTTPEQFREQGIREVLMKPMAVDEMATAIRRVLEEKEA